MNRQILRLAIPNIISNLTVPLISSVDTALVGHLQDISYLGAIAVGGMIFNFIYWGFGFLRMGTTGLTAQAFGNNDKMESKLTLQRAVLVAAGSALFLLIFQKLLLDGSFMLVDATAAVESNARRYFEIRIFAAPATLIMYAFTGWFFGMQNARYPLYLAVTTNILNVIFNLFFIKVMNMDVDGVALGTVCANYIGLLLGVYLIIRQGGKTSFRFDWQRLKNIPAFKRFFSLNFDIFIRTLLLLFAFSFFTAKSAEAGELILAANAILMNLWSILSYGIDGFAFASESLIGRFVGAKNKDGLKRAVRYSFAWGIGLAVAYSLVFWIFERPIIEIFTDKTEVITLTLSFMVWTIIAPVINSFCYIYDGIYIGATATKAMRNTLIISVAVFFLPLYYILQPVLGNHGLWLTMTIFMAVRGISLAMLYDKHVLSRLV